MKILDKEQIKKHLQRIAADIAANTEGEELAVIGIKTRGAFLAERIAKHIKDIRKQDVPVGALDITMYRDDLSEVAEQPVVHATELDFDITGKTVILVDDVFFTGRTVRCALTELLDYGRPGKIELAVLVDRGHRELPIRPDYAGLNVKTQRKEIVEVRLKETDGLEEAVILN